MLLQIENMREVDLDLFDFDYDLMWSAFFLNADGKIYGRYGARHPDSAKKYPSVLGLRRALEAALESHRREPPAAKTTAPHAPRTVEQYPAAQRLAPKACIHCHNVYEFRREAKQAEGTWKLDEVWVYPLPENLGLELDPDWGNRVRAVQTETPAARLGLKTGDVLAEVNRLPVAAIADVQYALNRVPAQGVVTLRWRRGGEELSGKLELPEGWRKTDLSWRWSLRSLAPDPSVRGGDLNAAERKALGLSEKQLALRQGPFVSPPARHAGVQINDVIVGVDGKLLEMTARQFDVYVRLNYRPGDRVTLNILRAGKRLELPLQFPGP